MGHGGGAGGGTGGGVQGMGVGRVGRRDRGGSRGGWGEGGGGGRRGADFAGASLLAGGALAKPEHLPNLGNYGMHHNFAL